MSKRAPNKNRDPNSVDTKGSRKKIVYSLDWNAQHYADRVGCVRELEKKGALDGLSPSQLNEVSNYLLYSDDVDCTVELRKPQKPPVSFEEMVQSGGADRAFINAKHKNIYKAQKPFIDREKDKDIPGMQELWEEIEKVKVVYDYIDDCLKGRREKDFDNPLEITYVTHHFYKNWYIDLCLQQYTLKDFYRTPVALIPQEDVFVRDDSDLEFGIRAGEYIYNESDEKFMIDLANPVHIYMLLRSYRQVGKQHVELATDDWNVLYDLLDRAVAATPLTDILWYILDSKVHGIKNDEISAHICEKWGVRYNDNYISTLFTKTISRKIAKAAMNNAKRDFDAEDIFICPKCKQERWEDEFNSITSPCFYCQGKMSGIGHTLRRGEAESERDI